MWGCRASSRVGVLLVGVRVSAALRHHPTPGRTRVDNPFNLHNRSVHFVKWESGSAYSFSQTSLGRLYHPLENSTPPGGSLEIENPLNPKVGQIVLGCLESFGIVRENPFRKTTSRFSARIKCSNKGVDISHTISRWIARVVNRQIQTFCFPTYIGPA